MSPERLAELVESRIAVRLPAVPRGAPTVRCSTGYLMDGCGRPATWTVDGRSYCVLDASRELRNIAADPERQNAALARAIERERSS